MSSTIAYASTGISQNPLPRSWITSNTHPIIEPVSFPCSSFSSCLSCLSCLSMFPKKANRINRTGSLFPTGHDGSLFHPRMIRTEGRGLDLPGHRHRLHPVPLPCAEPEALFRSLLAGIPLGEAARHQLEYRSGRPLVPDQAPLPGPGSTHRLAPDSAFDRVCWLRLLSRPDVGAPVQFFGLELPGFFRASGLVAAPQCSPGSAMTAQPFPPQRPLATEGSPGEYVPGKLCASHGTGRARHRLYPQTFKTGPIRCCR